MEAFDFFNMLPSKEKEIIKFIEKNTVTNLNLATVNLSTTRDKESIRYYYLKRYFANLIRLPFIETLDKNQINQSISLLLNSSKTGYTEIFNSKIGDFGSGEFLLYFLINSATLPKSKKSTDILVNNKAYEIKNARVSNVLSSKYAYGFDTGTYKDFDILNEIYYFATDVGMQVDINEIRQSQIEELRKNDKFSIIEKKYAKKIIDNHFKNELIIFNNKTMKIESISRPAVDDIKIYRVTRGSVQPYIKVN